MASALPDIPHNMQRLSRRFERWRSAHTGRLPIPTRLWAAAVELARQEGVFRTAKALRLEYSKLKQLAEAASRVTQAPIAHPRAQGSERRRVAIPRRIPSRSPGPAFVELIAPRPGSSPECRVELEGPRGRMRVDFKGVATAELVALSRALWDGEV